MILDRLKDFINLMERRTKAFDMAGGILSIFPWVRHIAPEASGYNVLVELNNEIKSLLMVRNNFYEFDVHSDCFIRFFVFHRKLSMNTKKITWLAKLGMI